MIKILREPLLYFLLLGGAMFALFQLVAGDRFGDASQTEEIFVGEGHIIVLMRRFEKTWQRRPSQEELDGLIQNYVREEVMYREALALDLDRDDPVVRQRLRQKLEFLSEDLAALEEPEDGELRAFLDANAESYRRPSRYSFRQVFVNNSEHGQSTEADAKELLTNLRSNRVEAADAGDAIMLEHQFDNETEWEIVRAFGKQFQQALLQIRTGSWQGPITSGFGLHLVHVSERIEGQIPKLDDVRDQVFRDWASQKRKQFNEEFYENLRRRYKVTVEVLASHDPNTALER